MEYTWLSARGDTGTSREECCQQARARAGPQLLPESSLWLETSPAGEYGLDQGLSIANVEQHLISNQNIYLIKVIRLSSQKFRYFSLKIYNAKISIKFLSFWTNLRKCTLQVSMLTRTTIFSKWNGWMGVHNNLVVEVADILSLDDKSSTKSYFL